VTELLWRISYNRSVALGVELFGLVFFGALTVYSLRRPAKHLYLTSLFLIDFGILSSLVRTLFFFHLSPHPARPGGIWRLVSGGIVLWGFALFERARRREREEQKDQQG
jgi:hypothetical protein